MRPSYWLPSPVNQAGHKGGMAQKDRGVPVSARMLQWPRGRALRPGPAVRSAILRIAVEPPMAVLWGQARLHRQKLRASYRAGDDHMPCVMQVLSADRTSTPTFLNTRFLVALRNYVFYPPGMLRDASSWFTWPRPWPHYSGCSCPDAFSFFLSS